MSSVNSIFIGVGALVAIIGGLSFFFPQLTSIINAPGGLRIKSTIALITGIIFLIAGIIIPMPIN